MGEDSYRRPSTLEDLSSRSRTREKYERDDSTFATSALDELHYRREMRGMVVSLALMTACGFDGSAGTTPDDPIVDAPTIPACTPGFINLCGQPKPTDGLRVTDTNDAPIDTSSDPRCRVLQQADGTEVCLLYFTDIDIGPGVELFAFGPRPLALAATGSIVISGTIDLASRNNGFDPPGAGSNPVALCTTIGDPASTVGGGGGGAGGTFVTAGGIGGSGGDAVGGLPGVAPSVMSSLRGGCNGQDGGNGAITGDGGTGGMGGGGIYLTAASIQISGQILTGGAGGLAVNLHDGGGGGGSGGAIVLESDSIAVTGLLLATGGGGAQGGAATSGGAGENATAPMPAQGGHRSSGGGFGGAGATTTNGSNGVADSNGGGGGGGGGGLILLLGEQPSMTGAMVMPPATALPQLPAPT